MSVHVIYHRADFDGLFSGAVCLHWLKKAGHDVTLTGWDFGDPVIDVGYENDIVYVVDLPVTCVTPEDCKMVWIDHHKSSIDSTNPHVPGYRIDGVAACRLAWQWFQQGAEGDGTELTNASKSEYVNRTVREPLALTLAGEYDVWDKRDFRAEQFQFGLTAHGPWKPETLADEFLKFSRANGAPTGDLESMRVGKVCNDGEAAMNWQQAYAEDVCRQRLYMVEWEGLNFCCLASVHARNSMWFPHNAIPLGADALMCYRIEGDGFVKVSLYHRPGGEELDLSPIAVKHSGGGHKGACGFQLTIGQAILEGILK